MHDLTKPTPWTDDFFDQCGDTASATPTGAGQTVLVNGDGEVVSATNAGNGSHSNGSTGGTGTTTTTTTTTTSGGPSPFTINISWDSSVSSAPAGFTTGVLSAVQWLESQISNPVTLNISVGYGEVDGYSLGGALGESVYYLGTTSYSSLTSALKSDATSATDAKVLASLPSTDPVSGPLWVTNAQEKALGLAPAGGTSTDGYVGFSSSYPFTYDDTNGVAAGTYDFRGTVLHEITEVMGRMMLTGGSIGSTGNSYSLYDLLHYSGPGVRDLSSSTAGYFSPDGGSTNMGSLNTVAGGDAGDWSSAVTNNSFDAFSSSGVVNAVTTSDLAAMDAIGWNLTGASAPPPAPPPPPASAPTSVSIAALATSLSTAVSLSLPFATLSQVGGSTADKYTYTLSGTGASAFGLSLSGNVGILKTGANGLAGTAPGKMYSLTVKATDVTSGLSSPAVPIDVIAGANGGNNISVATLSGSQALATTTFIFGRSGSDVLNGSGMSGKLWFIGGGGADLMTAGTGADSFMYSAASESTNSATDIINGFNVALDKIDLTGLGSMLQYAGAISGSVNPLAAHSIGWQVSGSDTFVYVNTSGAKESLGSTNMRIELTGAPSLSSSDFAHV